MPSSTRTNAKLWHTAKELKHDVHIYTLKIIILAPLLQHNEDLKGIVGEAKIITVMFLEYANVFCVSSETLK